MPPHPAVLALAVAGSSTITLADALGVTPAAASHYLRGLRRPHPQLADALRLLVGDDQARNVLALIPMREEHSTT